MVLARPEGESCICHKPMTPKGIILKPNNRFFGGDSEEATPVPIPNTEVKLFSADGTAREAVWESRTLPKIFFLSARFPIIWKRAEYLTIMHRAIGSDLIWLFVT